MKMKSLILVPVLLIANLVLAQKESFNFEKTSHNFGTIEENGGYATYEFKFTNTGNEPIKIEKVKASCGCTTPSWSKEEVAPGAEGHVRARYNPKNRPGKFNKSLTVTTEKGENIYLRISGNVLKAPLPPEKKFPYLSGDLRFKNKQVNAGAVMHDEITEVLMEVYNTTDSAIKLADVLKLPSHITLAEPDQVIEAKKFANVKLNIDPAKINDWGFRTEELTFNTGEKTAEIALRYEIRENFSKMTEEEKANAPEISLSTSRLNYGNVTKGKTVKSTITYTNKGQRDLIIREISTTCNCTVVKSKKNEIKPGKTGKLIVKLNTDEEDYNQNNIITLICNDPKAPVHTIQVRANITE